MSEINDQIPHNLPTEHTQTDVHYSSVEQNIHTEPIHNDEYNGDDEPEKENKGADKAIKYALVAGFLVILFVISLGLVSFLPSIISNVSSSASAYLASTFSSKPKITLTLDKTENLNNQPFVLSWKNNTTDTNGTYSFSFKCTEGVMLIEASSSKAIVCGTYFPLGNTNSGSIKIVTNSKNSGSTATPMNVTFFENGSTEPKLTNSVSIWADGTSGATNTQNNNYNSAGTSTNSGVTVTQNNSTTTNNSSSNYYYPANGKSDLAITLVKSGMVLNDGTFVQTQTINAGSRVLVQFNVANDGTAPSGIWSLTATLPTTVQIEKVFSSGNEPSLRPGDSYVMSLSFDSFDPSATQAILTILSSTDSNKANNTLSIPFSAGTGYNSYNSNYNNYYGNNNYNGNGALTVAITNLGQFNRSNGQFYYNGYNNNTIYSGSTVGVQFTVTNTGSTATGPWSFNATLPTNSISNNNNCYGYNCNNNYYNNYNGTYNYPSGTEPSLAPGQSMTFTIAFDNPNIGSDTVNISANGSYPQTINNTATRTFYVSN